MGRCSPSIVWDRSIIPSRTSTPSRSAVDHNSILYIQYIYSRNVVFATAAAAMNTEETCIAEISWRQ